MTTSPDDTPTKKCSKCGNEYPATSEYFMPHKGKLYSQCHDCRRAAKRESHTRNRDHNNARTKRWFDANHEYVTEYRRQYYQANVDAINERVLRWQKENPELVMAKNKRWITNHPEQVKAIKKRRRQRPDVKQKARAYKVANAIRNREWERQRYANNPEVRAKHKAKAHRRRMVEGDLDALIIREVYDEQNGRCRYCGITLGLSDWHLDHVYPISKGGTNERDNLACACAFCNLSKGSKTLAEWEAVRGW